MKILSLLLVFLLLSCKGGARDEDGDGYTADVDCNDADPGVHPDAEEEPCDSVDRACDGPSTFVEDPSFRDGDGDGFGDPNTVLNPCNTDEIGVRNSEDCDDTDPLQHPGASEAEENGIDDDCDGKTDEDVPPVIDADHDGFSTSEDCDDLNAAVNPDAYEMCDGVDNDCDGLVDSADPLVVYATVWYLDEDEDGFGAFIVATACEQPTGYAALSGDCDDADPAFHPGAPETCADPNDYNCDGATGYANNDGDAFAACVECDDFDPNIYPGATEWCNGTDDNCDGSLPASETDGDLDLFAPCTGDCDDTNPGVYPGAAESCGTVDMNCDGTAEACPVDTADSGFPVDTADTVPDTDTDTDVIDTGDSAADTAPPVDTGDTAQTADSGDTTDTADTADTPDTALADTADTGTDTARDSAGDTADSADSANTGDTAQTADTGDTGDTADTAVVIPADADGDGYNEFVDCNDGDAAVHPSATEVCNGVDDDCMNGVDVNASDATTWYEDADADGYGNASVTVTACSAPEDFVQNSEDCDDANMGTNPDATEVCDGSDNNCDGSVDEGFSPSTWYEDADGDGHGNPAAPRMACTQPTGTASANNDCDDTEAIVFPGAPERCDGLDNDCDGTVDDNCT